MSQQIINLGTGPDTQTGDTVYSAFVKVNDNFSELYTFFGNDGVSINANVIISNAITANGTVTATNLFAYDYVITNGNVVGSNFLFPNGQPYAPLTQADWSNVTASLIPTPNATYNLGSNANVFANAYIGNTVFINGTGLTTSNGNLFVNGIQVGGIEAVSYDSESGNLTIESTDGQDFIVDIGVGRSDSPTFTNLTTTGFANVNSLQVAGNTVIDSNATIRANNLPNSGVTAGSFGNASTVPVITIDSKGRITSATTTNVAGVSNVTYNNTSGNLTVSTSAGTDFTVDLGVGTADSPTFANITSAGFANVNSLQVAGNTVIDSNAVIRSTNLPTSGVTAGTYGNASTVPVITVDNKGRITSATTTNVAGVSNVTYNSTTGNLTISTSAGTTYEVDLGIGTSDSPVFSGISVSGNATVNALTVNGAVTVGGNITPSANAVYNLGSLTNKFKDLFLSGNSIYLDTATITSNANAVVITNAQGGQFVIDGTSVGSLNKITNGNSNVIVSANGNVNIWSTTNYNWAFDTDGNLFAPGNISAVGNVTASYFIGNISSPGANTQVLFNDNNLVAGNSNFTFDKLTSNLTVTGNIVTNKLTAAIIGNLGAVITGDTGTFATKVTTSNLATGAINANGTATVAALTSNGAVSGTTFTGTDATFTTKVTTANLATGNINSNGTVTVNNLITNSSITANTLNAATIGNAGATIVGATVSAATIGNSGTLLTGTLTTAAQPNITSVGSSLTIGEFTLQNNTISSTHGTITIDPANAGSTGNVVIEGNLRVTGNITYIDSQVISTNDKNILLANNTSNISDLNNGGILLGNINDVGIITWTYDTFTSTWQSNVGITPASNASYNLGFTTRYWNNAFVNTILSNNGLFETKITTSNLATGAINANGTATVNALTSNGAVSGTTYTGTDATFTTKVTTSNLATGPINANGTVTVSSLISNSAVSGTTGTFTTSTTTSALNTGTLNANGTATVASLTSNGNITLGGNIIDTGALAIQTGANGNISLEPNGTGVIVLTKDLFGTTSTFTTKITTSNLATGAINANGVATVNSLTSNGTVSGTTGTFTTNVIAGSIASGAINSNANITASGLTINNSATVGTTLTVVGNILSTGGNIYSNNRIGFTYSTNTTSAAYQFYNSATNSIDTVFG